MTIFMYDTMTLYYRNLEYLVIHYSVPRAIGRSLLKHTRVMLTLAEAMLARAKLTLLVPSDDRLFGMFGTWLLFPFL
jgi:hypothetical protein